MVSVATFKGEIRPYQQEALDKLHTMPHVGIFDQMGVGKTVEAIVFDCYYREKNGGGGKTLVVAPLTGVVDSWVRHFERHTDLKVRRIDPKKRHLLFSEEADVYVIHHEAVRLMADELASRDWLHIIVDEAHRIKNRKAKTTKALKQIKSVGHKTALTGTPMPNRPDELWSILHWLYQTKADREKAGLKLHYTQLLNSYWRFYQRFVEYIEIPPQMYHKVVGPKRTGELQDLMSSFTIRRLKSEVLSHLPPKQYTEYTVDLHPKQRKAYDQMKKYLIAWVGEQQDKPVVAPIVIAQLMRLQQFALGYGDVVGGGDGSPGKVKLREPSSKLDALLDIIDDAGDNQIVVYSQFSQAIDLAEKRLNSANYTTAKITGDVPQKLRTSVIKKFTDGQAQVFLATIGSGGLGIELVNSDTCIFLDRAWSPADNEQAEDRLHRSGQERPVHIIDIVANKTVDRGRKQTIDLKWSWVKEVIGA